MKTIATTSRAITETEKLLALLPPFTSIGTPRHGVGAQKYTASCTWPHVEILSDRSQHCFGCGETLADAIDEMMRQLDSAKAQGPVLKSAYAVKKAVINLIREHDAAPASFRAAVDDLRVSER